ncbi:hypothetical protein B0A54_08240 [Friedmanniomyces endolithicus]|uniref:Dynein light intermediate chain n=1 Tax=Friedmanniomyces endolithicus TaxID=329885 RepID=A0A4U0V017_9PEZI|nr:hypothetical protein B0A54_08240 [Friedmanniomyces endolithicus]
MSSAFESFRANLPPPAECLAILVGCMELTVFGLGGLANPVEFCKGYGLPLITSSSSSTTSSDTITKINDSDNDKLQQAYVAAIAARNIQNGVLLLTLGCYVRDRRALGVAVAAGLVATVADTLIVQYYGLKEAVWGHVFGEQRTEIWSNLLRQTREAQARSRTQAVQHRELIVCGGSPDDQQAFVRSLARPPPPAPPSRHRDQRGANVDTRRPKGEVRLSNRYAYGYGRVTLYSPPQQSAGVAVLLGGKAEEVARLELHTLPEPDAEYERTLRRLLEVRKRRDGDGEDADDGALGGSAMGADREGRRPAVCVLLSWKEPWRFLSLLRRWLQLIAHALLAPDAPAEDPLEVLKEHGLALTVVVQHVEAQEVLERENYREETFDYISQCIRTCILPISAGLVHTSSSLPPQQPGSALSQTQKLLYSSLGLSLSALSPVLTKGSTPAGREDLAPKHNVVDRMAIVVPSGWDSAGKIRLLSENFTPESVLEAWAADLKVPFRQPAHPIQEDEENEAVPKTEHANGGAEQEVYATSDAGEEDPDLSARSFAPSKPLASAIATYEQAIVDHNAHKAHKPPQIEVTTQPDQQFLAEMRAHLLHLEAEDAKHATKNPDHGQRVSNTSAGRAGASGLLSGEQTGALGDLGAVSFNVGGVNYNTVTAEAAIERLRRPQQPEESSPRVGSNPSLATSSPRTTTPRPPKREDREVSTGTPIPASTSSTRASGSAKSDDLPIDKLEEYFHSLMKRGGGGGSGASTPTNKGTGR